MTIAAVVEPTDRSSVVEAYTGGAGVTGRTVLIE